MSEDNFQSLDKLEQKIEARRLKEKFYEKEYSNMDPLFMTEYLNTKRAFTFNQTLDLGFPYWEYSNLQVNIFCLGRLVFKEWGQKMSLKTFFNLESGYFGQGRFLTYRNSKEQYMPTKGHIDLAEAEIGEYFVLKLKSKAGGSSFIEEIWTVEYDENLAESIQKIFQEVASRDE